MSRLMDQQTLQHAHFVLTERAEGLSALAATLEGMPEATTVEAMALGYSEAARVLLTLIGTENPAGSEGAR